MISPSITGRSLSACTSAGLTPGSCSNISNWKFDNFSLPAPYFSIRRSRNRSSKTKTLNSAICSFCCSCSISFSAWESVLGREAKGWLAALTMGYLVAEAGCGIQSFCAVLMRSESTSSLSILLLYHAR